MTLPGPKLPITCFEELLCLNGACALVDFKCRRVSLGRERVGVRRIDARNTVAYRCLDGVRSPRFSWAAGLESWPQSCPAIEWH